MERRVGFFLIFVSRSANRLNSYSILCDGHYVRQASFALVRHTDVTESSEPSSRLRSGYSSPPFELIDLQRTSAN
ncbi:hypothetical protein F5146DRAFT_1063753, partial [Armillaria mellea]